MGEFGLAGDIGGGIAAWKGVEHGVAAVESAVTGADVAVSAKAVAEAAEQGVSKVASKAVPVVGLVALGVDLGGNLLVDGLKSLDPEYEAAKAANEAAGHGANVVSQVLDAVNDGVDGLVEGAAGAWTGLKEGAHDFWDGVPIIGPAANFVGNGFSAIGDLGGFVVGECAARGIVGGVLEGGQNISNFAGHHLVGAVEVERNSVERDAADEAERIDAALAEYVAGGYCSPEEVVSMKAAVDTGEVSWDEFFQAMDEAGPAYEPGTWEPSAPGAGMYVPDSLYAAYDSRELGDLDVEVITAAYADGYVGDEQLYALGQAVDGGEATWREVADALADGYAGALREAGIEPAARVEQYREVASGASAMVAGEQFADTQQETMTVGRARRGAGVQQGDFAVQEAQASLEM